MTDHPDSCFFVRFKLISNTNNDKFNLKIGICTQRKGLLYAGKKVNQRD